MTRQIVRLEHFHDRVGLLSGVWFHTGKCDPPDHWKGDDHVQFMYFMLDGIIYRVQEDPSDGYRSAMEDIIVSNQMPLHVWQPGEEVMGVMCNKNSERKAINFDSNGFRDDRCEIVELISVATQKCVLEFGTDDSEDYYPSFVASFHPENMGINEDAANLLGEESKREL